MLSATILSASSSARMVTQRSTAAMSEMGSKDLAANIDFGRSFTYKHSKLIFISIKKPTTIIILIIVIVIIILGTLS